MSAFTEAVERGLEGLEHVSTGACIGCHECGLDEKKCEHCDGDGYLEDESGEEECGHCGGDGVVPVNRDEDYKLCELAESPHFSWSACDCCGSHLGGDRHPAHGWYKQDGEDHLVHLDVCADCLVYLANGDEPEEWRP